MLKNDLKLLDCTLRDGGYINNWNWGFYTARDIIRVLTKAKVDCVEVGFLRNIDRYDENVTVGNTIEQLNRLLPSEQGTTMYSAMVMCSNYDINKLSCYSGHGIELIRITAHDFDIEEGLAFAKDVKDKGYKISMNPINIMGYSDEQIISIIKQINTIMPYQFSIVDTFGSMRRRDLDRIVSLVDNNMNQDIRLALHLHENMSLSSSLAQQFVEKHLNRAISIDGSLLGMGRIPGNLPIELIADYLNDYIASNYDIDYMLDAIYEYISPIKGDAGWGYSPVYFLSAKFNLHRNYAEYYLSRGDLSHRDIDCILARFNKEKATVYDEEYAYRKYLEYKNNCINDAQDFEKVRECLSKAKILLIAPGNSINIQREKIENYIMNEQPIVISVNFCPEDFKVDYIFYSNSKRFALASDNSHMLIVTSNIEISEKEKADNNILRLNYNRLSSSFIQGYNSYIMMLKLLNDVGVSDVAVAGADGFIEKDNNYYKDSMKSAIEHDANYNVNVRRAVNRIGISVNYITDSAYI